ncbi:MAG: hypothetical protein IJ215_05865 [Clostridia bacterium]|nr:hypothetical protein [Clostridia bacterium]
MIEKRKKILTTLAIILLVLIFILISLQKFADEESDIRAKIGQDVGSSTLSINEFVLLSERTIGVFFKYLRENRIEEAYSLLSPEYREVVTFENFQDSFSNMELTYEVKNISRRTENMYVASVELSGENCEMLIIMNGDRFYVVPEPFIKYIPINNSISKDGVKYTLIGYQINVDSCIIDMTITNNKKQDISILGSNIKKPSGYTIQAEGEGNATFAVPAGETKDVEIFFKTSLDFPVEFEIDREDNEKIRMYKFRLD